MDETKRTQHVGFIGTRVIYKDIMRNIYFISGRTLYLEFKDEYELKYYVKKSKKKFEKIDFPNKKETNNPFLTV